jgi:hypothetical protein
MAGDDPNLNRLRDEILDHLRGMGLPVFHAFGMPDDQGFVYWDGRAHPNWEEFLRVARECGARWVVMSAVVFDDNDLQVARETLEGADLDRAQQQVYQQLLRDLERRTGDVAWLRVAYTAEDRWFAYERMTSWYDEFREMMDALEEFAAETGEDAEPEPGRGFFSPN